MIPAKPIRNMLASKRLRRELMSLKKTGVNVVLFGLAVSLLCSVLSTVNADDNIKSTSRPNVLFIFSDDHAVNAISSYGGPLPPTMLTTS